MVLAESPDAELRGDASPVAASRVFNCTQYRADKPFSCLYCKLSLFRKDVITRHTRNFHPDKMRTPSNDNSRSGSSLPPRRAASIQEQTDLDGTASDKEPRRMITLGTSLSQGSDVTSAVYESFGDSFSRENRLLGLDAPTVTSADMLDIWGDFQYSPPEPPKDRIHAFAGSSLSHQQYLDGKLPTRKRGAFYIEDEQYQRAKQNYEAVTALDRFLSYRFPSKFAVTRFVRGFFECMAPHMPIVHLPTFNIISTPAPLLIKIMACGALYAKEPTAAQSLHLAALLLMRKHGQSALFHNKDTRVETLRRGVQYKLSLAHEAIRDLEAPEQPKYMEWVHHETLNRCLSAIAILSAALFLDCSERCSLLTIQHTRFPLPSSASLWSKDESCWNRPSETFYSTDTVKLVLDGHELPRQNSDFSFATIVSAVTGLGYIKPLYFSAGHGWVHFSNHFEDNGKFYFDLFSTDGDGLSSFVDAHPELGLSNPNRMVGKLVRFTIDPKAESNKLALPQVLSHVNGEMARIDDRYVGKPYRHTWGVIWGSGLWDGIVHVDTHTGVSKVWQGGDTVMVHEPCFVPTSKEAPEGDGHLVCVARDERREITYLIILDAQNITAGPVCLVEMPLRLHVAAHERHKARHASKDRLAGGLGLGILRTKRHRHGRLILPSNSSRAQPLAASQDQQGTGAIHRPGTSMISSAMHAQECVLESDVSTIGNVRQTAEPSASFDGLTSTDPQEGILSTDGFGFLELGDMYHDSTFDFMHFNVTGDPQSPGSLRDLSLVTAQDDLPLLPQNSLGLDLEGQSVQAAAAINSSMIRTPTECQSPDSDTDLPDLQSTGGCNKELNETSSTSAEVDSLCSLGRLGLNNLYLTETKRREILGLINDMRPVYPNGTSIDESTADLSLARMQDYLDLFFSNFNSCYPMIHTPTLEVLDAEPLFLLSLIVLGATYKEKEDHQLSVCLYDAMTPYIMSGLSGIKVPDLSILQAFMVLECYGMYRAGAYQRENSIIMHTFLFNAIRRLSRYHVRARIMVPDLRTDREKDWKSFAYIEQYKRLILFIFMWDTQNVSYYSFMPSMSTQSIQVNLPCSKELWEAKDEDAWEAITSKSDPPMINTMVKDFIEGGGNIWCETLDSLSLSFILHGLMSMCNDMVHFHNQSIYLGNAAQGDDNNWRCRMTAALELWKTKYDACAMGARQTIDEDSSLHEFRQENVAFLALYHTAHIVVNADIRHLQIAAGAEAIFGHVVTSTEREESIRAVKEWVRLSPESAGHATWHAAQMILEGLLNLRNWKANGMFHYPWCIYIGVLTTWAFVHFSQGQSANHRGCHHSVGGEDVLQTQSKALMHQTISNMASCTPYLKTVRWTAAFEAMKVLEGIVDME
ncbi:hypothetical protein FVER53590_03388 [Fusarium verticillioides]|nr:hypothetical protein FVER53590_03388 [Fusarium verticillioides]